jgi:hypothetical protein
MVSKDGVVVGLLSSRPDIVMASKAAAAAAAAEETIL